MSEPPTDRRVLRILNWDAQFECNRTRDRKNITWIAWSNRTDSDAWTDIIPAPNGRVHWCVWNFLAMIASRCDRRGYLYRDNGRPHTAGSLSRCSGIPCSEMEESIERLRELEMVSWEAAESKIIVAAAAVDEPKVNGVVPAEPNLSEFDRWFTRWADVTGRKVGKSEAAAIWMKFITPEAYESIWQCSESYWASHEVVNGAIMDTAKWLRKNFKDHWQARWHAGKPNAKAMGVAESVENLVKERIARGERPL